MLCKTVGPQVYERCKTTILEGISNNIERDLLMEGSVTEQEQSEKLIDKLSSSPRGEKVPYLFGCVHVQSTSDISNSATSK